MLFPTTVIGSFPMPGYLKDARSRFQRGELGEKELKETCGKAIKEVVALQESIGLDILSDGEFRGDMVAYPAERLGGFKIGGLVRSYGNRYYHKPIIAGKVEFIRPINVENWKLAQSFTDKPLKGIFAGPYTMMDWSFDEHYPTRREATLDIAEALHWEAVELEKAGARFIQIDEPALSARPEEIKLVIEAEKIVVDGLKAKTIIHICYGDFESIYPRMLDLPVDQLALEFSNSRFDLFQTFRKHKFTKEIGLGVLDVHSHVIESKEEIKRSVKSALEVFEAGKVYLNPDCGLKTRTEEEASGKLAAMVDAAKELRNELGG